MADPHQNYYADWQTPPEWVAWARESMGEIDLDPCGAKPDRDTIGAWSTLLVGDGADGLSEAWHGRVYCNPPGSNSIRSVRAWWAKAVEHLRNGEISELTWCFFNWEAVLSLENSPLGLRGWLVLPKRRVSFLRDGERCKSPRNRTVFWTTARPAQPPVSSYILATGYANVVEVNR